MSSTTRQTRECGYPEDAGRFRVKLVPAGATASDRRESAVRHEKCRRGEVVRTSRNRTADSLRSLAVAPGKAR